MSSVEWLANRIDEIIELYPSERQLLSDARKQAKAMHKEEYIDAWMNGQNDSGYSQKELRKMAEEDYNETFHPDQVDGDGEEPKGERSGGDEETIQNLV